jgi:hypothetical protein
MNSYSNDEQPYGSFATMKKFLLILFISVCGCVMVGCPGLYDTRRTRVAWRHYHDAPSETTRRELHDAKRLDRREILVWEAILGAALIGAFVALVRVSKVEAITISLSRKPNAFV